MVWLIVQISGWVNVFCCSPKQHFIFPLSSLNKRRFSKGRSMHPHSLSSFPNINFILCLHRKKTAISPMAWWERKWQFQMIQIKYGYNCMCLFISGQFYLSPNWFCCCPSLLQCFLPNFLSTYQDGHLSRSLWGMSVVAVNSETDLTQFVLMENSTLSQEYPAIGLCQERALTSTGALHTLCR